MLPLLLNLAASTGSGTGAVSDGAGTVAAVATVGDQAIGAPADGGELVSGAGATVLQAITPATRVGIVTAGDAIIYWPAKAPGELEDFAFEFAGVLQPGETIATRTVTVTGVTKNSDATAGTQAQVWLQGGALGTTGIIVCAITTNLGRTYDVTGILPIGEEPVNINMAKTQCRAEGTTADDDLFIDLIQSAREYVEQYTGSRLVPAAVGMSFSRFEDLAALTEAPVQSITQVQYLDANGALQTLDPSVYQFLQVSSDPLRPAVRLAFNQAWPATCVADDAVRVSASVGYTVVPRPLIRAMLLLIGQWYDYRTGIQVDARGSPAEIPNAVTALLANYRR